MVFFSNTLWYCIRPLQPSRCPESRTPWSDSVRYPIYSYRQRSLRYFLALCFMMTDTIKTFFSNCRSASVQSGLHSTPLALSDRGKTMLHNFHFLSILPSSFFFFFYLFYFPSSFFLRTSHYYHANIDEPYMRFTMRICICIYAYGATPYCRSSKSN